ncbi:MAG: YdcF family protein [Myxococcota bacterium]
MRIVLLALITGCAHRADVASLQQDPLDVVVIPGCPNRPDGSLSGCQWQRAIWGAQLWEDGVTEAFITSGGAVQNRWIESESIKAGMVALGVPADRIHLETQALHTDENTGYAVRIAGELGFGHIGMASHGGQARGMRAMAKGWGVEHVEVLPMDLPRVVSRIQDGLPEVEVEPVPADEWMPLKEREKEIARRLDERRRPPSWWVYSMGAMFGKMKRDGLPEPPVVEPTLRGERHRVDTRPWASKVAHDPSSVP